MMDQVEALLERSHRLGSDPRVTNYAGGNTSCKLAETDPVTGRPITLLWIKGSGGDLGTLQREGLAVLVLERVRALRDRYRGPEREDDMVPLLEHCRFGDGGAAASIDTPLHALLAAAHVDHTHPDAVIALAASRDGESLTRSCFGDEVGWLDWRRPGFELATRMAALAESLPSLRGIVLGGHGLFAWGEDSETCEQTTVELVERAESFIKSHGSPAPFGAARTNRRRLDDGLRRQAAAAVAPVLRGLCSTDVRVVGQFTDSPAVTDFLEGADAPVLSELGTSCPDHFLRTKVRPLLCDLPSAVPPAERIALLRELHDLYRKDYTAYYERYATASSPPMRGADPAVVLLPGIGMWSFGPDVQTARVAGEFYLNAVNVMRGAQALSAYEPISEPEKFAIEYWTLEEAKLRRRPAPPPLQGRVALVTGAGSGIGRAVAQRLSADGAAVVVCDLDESAAHVVTAELGDGAALTSDRAVAVSADVSDEEEVDELVRSACRAYAGIDIVVHSAGLSIGKPLLETTADDWDRQHRVMARGSFLVSRAVARVLMEQGMGGDIVYIVSKNATLAGPSNVAYGAAKADQAHQVRLLAAELGEHGIRVNGVNPDAVVRGSGIFEGDWGAQRAAAHGVAREDLGRFYAERTLLKREVTPGDVADAVATLVSGELGLTTGTSIPVDGGVPGAFPR